MGIFISKLNDLYSSLSFGNQECRILMLGLDNAGKTSILYKVKLNENIQSIPTIGFNVEKVSPIQGVTFTVWDIGGQTKLRPLWRHYFNNVNGLFYVVDSSDPERVNESAEELHSVLEDDQMSGVPVVIIANKQDLPKSMKVSELVERLRLEKLASYRNKWHVQSACAVTGEGIYESMEQLVVMIKNKK
jgi:ADP-ribosylation factor protein 1